MGAEIVVERDTDLSPAEVFRAWTDATRFATWWWPQFPDVVYEIDARPGGAYRIWSAAIGIGAHGEYSVVEPPSRLDFTWVWDGDGGHPPDPVTVTIEPNDGGGARVRLRHDCSADEQGVADLTQGWNDVLDRLAALTA